MPGGFHDRGGHRWNLRIPAVNFEPDLDALTLPILAKLPQSRADILDRRLTRNFLRQPVRTHLHAPSPDVMRQIDELLADLDLFPPLANVRRMKFASRPKAQ